MYQKIFQIGFLILAIIITIYNVRERFFTKRVKYSSDFKMNIYLLFQTTISYETRELTEMEFPMYFSLVPDPGYNISHLVSRGIDGEWNLFKGSLVETQDNRTSWTGITWGGLNYSIKGKVRPSDRVVRSHWWSSVLALL